LSAVIYSLSLHDALPIWRRRVPVVRHGDEYAGGDGVHLRVVSCPRREDRLGPGGLRCPAVCANVQPVRCDVTREKVLTDGGEVEDRKSTRLNSSHVSISY